MPQGSEAARDISGMADKVLFLNYNMTPLPARVNQ